MVEPSSGPKPPDHDQVREQARRIASSALFSKATRHKKLLFFLVEEVLAGHQDEIKESRIGVEVFEKKANYNPQDDATARVEAGRLRTKLDAYYGTEGAADPIRISLPDRGYVLTYSWAGAAPQQPLISEIANNLAPSKEPPPQETRPLTVPASTIRAPSPATNTPATQVQHAETKSDQNPPADAVRTTVWRRHPLFLALVIGIPLIVALSVGVLVWHRHNAEEAQAYFREAKLLYEAHQSDLALQKLQVALKLNPKLAEAHALLATVYLFERDNRDLSFKHICLAMKNNRPSWNWDVHARSVTLLGTLNRETGNFGEALKSFQYTLSLYAEHNDIRGMISSHNNLGLVYESLHDTAKAGEHLRLARDLSDNLGDPVARARSLLFIGNHFYGLGRGHLDEALQAYKDALNIIAGKSPSDEATLSLNIGAIYYDRKEWDNAESAFRDSLRIANELRLSERAADAHNALGNIHKMKKQWDAALDEFKIALPLFKTSQSGRYIDFVSTVDQKVALELRRNDVNVLWSMQDVSLKKKDYKSAIKYCEEELQLVPESSNAHYNLACTYCLVGDSSMALRELQKVKMDQSWASMAESDDDLKCLRGNPLFVEMIKTGKTKPQEAAVRASAPPFACAQ